MYQTPNHMPMPHQPLQQQMIQVQDSMGNFFLVPAQQTQPVMPQQRVVQGHQQIPQHGMMMHGQQQTQYVPPQQTHQQVGGQPRFTTGNGAVPLEPASNVTRYNNAVQQQQPPQQVVVEEEVPELPAHEMLAVSPNGMNVDINGFHLKTRIAAIPDAKVLLGLSKNLTGIYSLDDAIQVTSERLGKLDEIHIHSTLCVIEIRQYHKAKDASRVKTVQEQVNTLLALDAKNLYRKLGQVYRDTNSTPMYLALNLIDKIATDYINDIMPIHCVDRWKIGTFRGDFNDLLKMLRNEYDYVEDNVVEHMTDWLRSIGEHTAALVPNEDEGVYISIAVPTVVVCTDLTNVELGLSDTSRRVITTHKIDPEYKCMSGTDRVSSNELIYDLAVKITTEHGVKSFILSDASGKKYRFSVNMDGEHFITML